MRILALIAAHNEESFIGACLDHLWRQGLEVYLIDNGSTDRTVAIAERYLDRGLLTVEQFPRNSTYSWRPLLERKQELAATLPADWFVHVDPDEIRLPPAGFATLVEAFTEVERRGYNAVNFQEFTFVPTREAPDHDHPRFRDTMRRYYAFRRQEGDQVKAWKHEAPVDLVSSAGHRVEFPGLQVYPESFPMCHYLFLSRQHAIRKYLRRRYDPAELAAGWHGARAALRLEDVTLLPESKLRLYTSDGELDPSDPWPRHPLFAGS